MNMVKDGLASHERCTCGHCRCDHASGFQGCEVKRCACARYTWPGPGAKVPANHRARQHFPRTAEKAEGSVRSW